VYVIAHANGDGCRAPVKVGVATDVGKRLEQLQSGNPYELRVWDFILLPNRDAALLAEQAFHTEQSSERLRGEWFSVEPEAAISWLEGFIGDRRANEAA
jgi:hypothetical protein